MVVTMQRNQGERVVNGLIFVVFAVIVVAACVRVAHELSDPCVEWRETGSVTCTGSESWTRCEPERECVRRESGWRK